MTDKRKNLIKKAISLCLVLLMVFSAFPLTAFAYCTLTPSEIFSYSPGSGDITYYYRYLADGTIELYNERKVGDRYYYSTQAADFYDSTGNAIGVNVTIPSEIDGLPVTGIGDIAFSKIPTQTDLESKELSLTQVTFQNPSYIKKIDHRAFAYNNKLLTIDLPDGVESIGTEVFFNCDKLESVTMTDSVTELGTEVFSGCNSLQEVTLSDNIEVLPYGTFISCMALTKIHLPSNLKEIGVFAFAYCPSMTEYELPEGLIKIDNYAFSECYCLQRIVIPSTVTTLGDNIFSDATELQSVTIPASVTSIGDDIFTGTFRGTVYVEEGSYAEAYMQEYGYNYEIYDPNELPSDYTYNILDDGSIEITGYTGEETELVIPEEINGHAVKGIAPEAFVGTETITSIVVPDGVEYIGDAAFAGSEVLQSVTLPDSVTSIGHVAFAESVNLTEVNLPQNLESIGELAFALTSITELTIPASLTDIGMGAFAAMIALEGFSVDEDSELFTTEDGLLLSKDKTVLVAYPCGYPATSYEIPDYIT